MARLDPISLGELSPEQKTVHDKLAATRKGRVSGPFAVWLRIPNLAATADDFTRAMREQGLLQKRQFELLVLIVTRRWSARYAWAQHEPLALAAGLPPEIVTAIREKRMPKLDRPDEQVLYDMATELLDTTQLSQTTYDRMLAQFGIERTVEAISVVGFYGMVSTVLNGFDVPTLNGEKPF